jgi:hypothetical protein
MLEYSQTAILNLINFAKRGSTNIPEKVKDWREGENDTRPHLINTYKRTFFKCLIIGTLYII